MINKGLWYFLEFTLTIGSVHKTRLRKKIKTFGFYFDWVLLIDSDLNIVSWVWPQRILEHIFRESGNLTPGPEHTMRSWEIRKTEITILIKVSANGSISAASRDACKLKYKSMILAPPHSLLVTTVTMLLFILLPISSLSREQQSFQALCWIVSLSSLKELKYNFNHVYHVDIVRITKPVML